jgi:hypothetical protein
MSGLYVISVKLFEADPKSSAVIAIFSAVILSCLLMSEGENLDRLAQEEVEWPEDHPRGPEDDPRWDA